MSDRQMSCWSVARYNDKRDKRTINLLVKADNRQSVEWFRANVSKKSI